MKVICISIIVFLSLFATRVSGQMDQYRYFRELKTMDNKWYKIAMPDEVYEKVQDDLADIRVFGITSKNDTLEAPYILNIASEKLWEKEVSFKLLNTAKAANGYSYTFEILTQEAINQINLHFEQQNFDWHLQLEGSQNQQEWFTLTKDYRILAINNNETNYSYTKVVFPNCKYRFFRLLVTANEQPNLLSADLILQKDTAPHYKNYEVQHFKRQEDKLNKQTIFDVKLKHKVPISYIRFVIPRSVDYHRSISIKYLNDSLKTETGWKYHYKTLTWANISSTNKNEFKFQSSLLQQLRIVFENQDNEPLSVDSFVIKGFEYSLVARINKTATYYLAYGNSNARKPQYDITRFTSHLPDSLVALQPGIEHQVSFSKPEAIKPLFMSKGWLWSILLLIIAALGWFSVKMMKHQ